MLTGRGARTTDDNTVISSRAASDGVVDDARPGQWTDDETATDKDHRRFRRRQHRRDGR